MSEPATARDAVNLISEGNAALIAGDPFTARQRFRQAIDADPDNPEAWLGMAASVRPYREKHEHLQRALALQPDHPGARAALAEVGARLAAGEVLAPTSPREARQAAVRAEVAHAPTLAAPAGLYAEPVPATPTTLHCYIHPGRETGLRCTGCDRPICSDCVRPAPVGQLCPECARARRPTNYKVSWVMLGLAGVISLIYGLLATFLGLQILMLARFFAFILVFVLGPLAGNLLVRGLDKINGNKRGRAMQISVAAGYLLGALPWLAALLFAGGGLTIILLGLLTGLAITAALAALR